MTLYVLISSLWVSTWQTLPPPPKLNYPQPPLKFILFTRLFGRNVLKVLATLLFLTHSQLMHASFQSLRYADLYVKTQNGTRTTYIWSFDGNISYFRLRHMVLFLLAVVCLLLMLFFTLCLLFVQYLQKHNNRWYLYTLGRTTETIFRSFHGSMPRWLPFLAWTTTPS